MELQNYKDSTMCSRNPNRDAVIKIICEAKKDRIMNANDLIFKLTKLVDAAYIKGLADGCGDFKK